MFGYGCKSFVIYIKSLKKRNLAKLGDFDEQNFSAHFQKLETECTVKGFHWKLFHTPNIKFGEVIFVRNLLAWKCKVTKIHSAKENGDGQAKAAK